MALTKVTSGVRTIASGEVVTASIADANVTGAKVAMGSDARGDILFRNASIYARLAAGTAGAQLQTGGAGADPSWVVSTPWIPLQRIVSTGVAAYSFTTGLSATYRDILLSGYLVPVTDDVQLWMRTSTNAGGAYDAGSTDYEYSNHSMFAASSTTETSTGAPQILVGGGAGATAAVGNAASEHISFNIESRVMAVAALKTTFSYDSMLVNSVPGVTATRGGGYRDSAADVDGLQLLFESGNIASGDVTMYGRKPT